jgi:Heterokaryon incompatibility protein (HET)
MRPPDPSVSRDDVFDAFRVSLQTCLSDHKKCEKPNPNQLPTRLLLLDDDVSDRVFVHECKPGERGNYVALSYCWGTTTQIKLLKTNLDDFSKKGIEVGTLPKTIEDSIIATRKLGVKYLWIDSLCIIQDSIEDKDKEIVRMASIYKNATITISAAAATDCGQGFLEDRSDVQLRLNISMRLPFLRTADEEILEAIDWIYLCPDPHMGHKVKRFSEEAINTRAWTYQESTLAPRLLIFGSGPPQWHCKESWKIDGLNIHPKNLPNHMCPSGIMKFTIQNNSIVADQTLKYLERPEPPKDDIGLWLTWFPLLENYSHRALSYPTDKLLALSALAAEHQSPQNGTYAAGLWNASLPRGLLWRRLSSNSVAVHHAQQQAHSLNWLRTRLFDTSYATKLPEPSAWSAQYVAPTWSPMSSRDPICFKSAATQEEDEFHTSLVEINDIHVELTTNINPFGRLNFGYLNVTAPMCSMSWQELTANFVIIGPGEPFAYWDFIISDDPAFFDAMCEKYLPSSNPQTLADRSIQHPIDDGDFSLLITDAGVRVRMPVIQEPASRECPDADIPFTSVLDVKQAVFDTLLRETPVTGSCDGSESPVIVENDECDFWLLEVERSMSPAGLVLRRVHGDIFARVGYFGMNRSLDPEIVFLPGGVQVRGSKTWNWHGPEGKSSWNDGLTRRRICLV